MRATRSTLPPRATCTDELPAAMTRAAFSREGEYWTIAYDGVVLRLRDSKGLRCIAFLLRRPGQTVKAVELVAAGQPAGAALRRPNPVRARVTVTKRIRGAIAKLTAQHASLGHHLGTCIRTGGRCAYIPDPTRPPGWSF